MTDARHRRGRHAENLVADWLTQNGWIVLERRWRRAVGEIDLVCRDPDNWLVAVEVRFRAGQRTGTAIESVSPVHLGRLRQALAAYAQEQPDLMVGLRVDLVAVAPAGPNHWRLERVPGIADGR
jgi:putative endonuclease